MSEQAFFWIAGIFAVIVGAIGGAFWAHVNADNKKHEDISGRLSKVETKVEALEPEVGSIRKRLHDFFDGLKRGDYELIEARYQKFTADLAKLREEVLGWVEALKTEIRALFRRKRGD